jgi:hypothetical protein
MPTALLMISFKAATTRAPKKAAKAAKTTPPRSFPRCRRPLRLLERFEHGFYLLYSHDFSSFYASSDSNSCSSFDFVHYLPRMALIVNDQLCDPSSRRMKLVSASKVSPSLLRYHPYSGWKYHALPDLITWSYRPAFFVAQSSNASILKDSPKGRRFRRHASPNGLVFKGESLSALNSCSAWSRPPPPDLIKWSVNHPAYSCRRLNSSSLRLRRQRSSTYGGPVLCSGSTTYILNVLSRIRKHCRGAERAERLDRWSS